MKCDCVFLRFCEAPPNKEAIAVFAVIVVALAVSTLWDGRAAVAVDAASANTDATASDNGDDEDGVLAVVDFSMACEELLADSIEFCEGRDGMAEPAPDTTMSSL